MIFLTFLNPTSGTSLILSLSQTLGSLICLFLSLIMVKQRGVNLGKILTHLLGVERHLCRITKIESVCLIAEMHICFQSNWYIRKWFEQSTDFVCLCVILTARNRKWTQKVAPSSTTRWEGTHTCAHLSSQTSPATSLPCVCY